jgi:glycosyltransferase involved in cell wall biosynthesis
MNISAVIPAYNCAAFIEEAIDSILRQSQPIDEIIIVDDGSTDNTEELVRSMANNTANPTIVYTKQDNEGPSSARNRGIEIAKGDWIAFLDADDRWTPNKIALQMAALEKEPTLQLIAGDMTETDQQGAILVESVLAKHDLLDKFQTLAGRPIPNVLTALLNKNFIPTGTVLVKRAVLQDVGGFNPHIRFGEDLELWAKIACHHPITCLPEVLMYRRQHGGNATQSTVPMLEDLVKVMRSITVYGSEQLMQQGAYPNTLVASAFADLAYWHFSQCNYRLARKIFTLSIKEHPNKRAFFYAMICLLPTALIDRAKTLKQRNHEASR